MEINVGTILIKMVKFTCIWMGINGVSRKMGSNLSILYAPFLSFFLTSAQKAFQIDVPTWG